MQSRDDSTACLITSIDLIPQTLRCLIDNRSAQSDFSGTGMQHHGLGGVASHSFDSVKFHLDDIWIESWGDYKVELKMLAVAIEDHVDSWINVLVANPAIVGDVSVPFIRTVADQIISFSRNRIDPDYVRRGVGINEFQANDLGLIVAFEHQDCLE